MAKDMIKEVIIMAFFETLGTIKEKTKDIAHAGKQMSKQFVEIAKLNMANASEEEGIRKAYLEIGKLYYAERGLTPDAPYAALCERVTSAKTLIAENKAKIETIRAEEGISEEDPVEDTVPPEEPTAADSGCDCCGHSEQPEQPASAQTDKPEEEAPEQ